MLNIQRAAFLIYSFFGLLVISCTSDKNVEDFYVDEIQEIGEYNLSKAYKIKSGLYLNAGVQKASKIKTGKVIVIGPFLYSVEEIPLSENELQELSDLFIAGVIKMNIRRDKDVDAYFLCDYLLVYSANDLVSVNRENYVLLSLREETIISYSYQKYDFKKDQFKKLISKLEEASN